MSEWRRERLFLRGPREEPVDAASALARWATSPPEKGSLLVLDGDEPASRPGFGALLASALRLGFEGVELPTNGVAPDPILACVAAHPGRLRATLSLPSVDATIHEALTGRSGMLTESLAGGDALANAGIPLVVTAPVTRINVGTLEALVEFVAERWPGVEALRLRWYVPRTQPTRAAARLVAPPHEAGPLLLRAARAAEVRGLPMGLDADTNPPPCLFEEREALAPLFPAGRGLPPEQRTGPCRDCCYAPHCAGFRSRLLLRGRTTPPAPITDDGGALFDSLRVEQEDTRALSFASAEQAVGLVRSRDEEGRAVVSQAIVRITDRCNFRCAHCWVQAAGEDLPEAEVDEQVRIAIDNEAEQIALSGGEPTLLPERLLKSVRELRTRSTARLMLQTNAVQLGRDRLAERLAEAGLEEVFISLASHVPTTFDAYVGTKGQLPKVLAGIDQAVEAGLDVYVNQVVYRGNFEELPDFAAFLCERWGPRVVYCFSYAFVDAESDETLREALPPYDELAPLLARALDTLLDAGVRVESLQAACGIPLCVLDADDRYYGPIAPLSGEANPKPEVCSTCTLSPCCRGPRAEYTRAWGARGLRPAQNS